MGIGVTALTDIKLKEERDMAKQKTKSKTVVEKPKLVTIPKPESGASWEEPKPKAKPAPKPKPVKYDVVYIEATVKGVVHAKNLLVVAKPIYAGRGATLLPYIELTEEIKKRLG